MSTIGNILWMICGGLIGAAIYVLGGLLCCVTIIGIPFGVQAFKLAGATLAPFGKTVVTEPGGDGLVYTIFNMVWLCTAGLVLAVNHLVHAGALAVTIIGIPFAVQHIKLIPLCLFPFGHSLK